MLIMFIGIFVFFFFYMSKCKIYQVIKLSLYYYRCQFSVFERYASKESGTRLEYFPVTEPYKHV